MIDDTYDDLLAQWFGIVQPTRHRENIVSKPTHLYRYVGGFRMGQAHQLQIVKRDNVARIEEYRSAHP